jgi:hypothetical protein
MVFACDRWDQVSCNLHAIEMTISALRGIARWGSSEMVEQAFAGFQALPGPGDTTVGRLSWWVALGVRSDADMSDIETRARELRAEFHPDKNPGDASAHERFVAVSDALTAARKERAALSRA